MQVSSGETGPLQNGERAAILRAALLASPSQPRRLTRLASVEPFRRFVFVRRIAARKTQDEVLGERGHRTTEDLRQEISEDDSPSATNWSPCLLVFGGTGATSESIELHIVNFQPPIHFAGSCDLKVQSPYPVRSQQRCGIFRLKRCERYPNRRPLWFAWKRGDRP
jgi:hypothetical protein